MTTATLSSRIADELVTALLYNAIVCVDWLLHPVQFVIDAPCKIASLVEVLGCLRIDTKGTPHWFNSLFLRTTNRYPAFISLCNTLCHRCLATSLVALQCTLLVVRTNATRYFMNSQSLPWSDSLALLAFE